MKTKPELSPYYSYKIDKLVFKLAGPNFTPNSTEDVMLILSEKPKLN
jgi:hypothetical protein